MLSRIAVQFLVSTVQSGVMEAANGNFTVIITLRNGISPFFCPPFCLEMGSSFNRHDAQQHGR